jgi:hypothetical protein
VKVRVLLLVVAVFTSVMWFHPRVAGADEELAPIIRARGSLQDACRNRTPKGFIWCWGHRFGASPRKAVCIARAESGLNPAATNGTHDGLFQWSRAYWPSTRNQFPQLKLHTAPSAFNARTNSAYALKWQADIGYSPWSGNPCV